VPGEGRRANTTWRIWAWIVFGHQRPVTLTDPAVKFQRLCVHAVPLGTRLGRLLTAAQPFFGRNVQVERQVGLQPTGCKRQDGAQRRQVEPMTVALVRQGAVGIAIADHDLARSEPGLDLLRDQLGTRRRVQQNLGPGVHAGVFQVVQHGSDLVADGCPARLARREYGVPPPAQELDQGRNLGGFAAAVRSFKRDKHGLLHLECQRRPACL